MATLTAQQDRDVSQVNGTRNTFTTGNTPAEDASRPVSSSGGLNIPQISRWLSDSRESDGQDSNTHGLHDTTVTSVIDILSNGKTIDHNESEPLVGQSGTPTIGSPPEPCNIRVIFKSTHDVFADNPQEPQTSMTDSEVPEFLKYNVNPPTFDEPSGELSRHNYDLWNWYQGGFGVDSTSVFRLLECENERVELRVGTNLMFYTENKDNENSDKIWWSKFRQGQCVLTLNGIMHNFYTVPNLLRFWRQPDSNTLNVEIICQSIYPPGEKMNAKCVHSPLRNRLGTLLLSGKSAVSLFNGNMDAGVKLLTFDILSATIACWIDFLKLVRLKSAWQSHSFKNLESIEKFRPLLDDRAYVADFDRSARDLQQAVETTIKVINADDGFDDKNSNFRQILLYREVQREVLQFKVKDIRDNMEQMAEQTKALTEEKQAASLKRLTLVASIFLPLTTACSLLSMTNRVSNIGAIWWDWLGIVTTIGLLVFVGYQISKYWDDFRHENDKQVKMRTWQGDWSKARYDILREEWEEKQGGKQHRNWKLRSPNDELRHQRGSLIPSFNRKMFRLSKYIFMTGAVASFLIGMFIDIRLGAESLGYSAAGTVLIVIGSIVIYHFGTAINGMISRARHPAKVSTGAEAHESNENSQNNPRSGERKAAWYLLLIRKMVRLWMLSISLGSAKHTTDSTATKPPARLLLNIFKWIVVIPLSFMYRFIYWIVSIFFGKPVLQVMLRTLKSRLEYEDPEFVRYLREHSSDLVWKPGNNDEEAHPSRHHHHDSSGLTPEAYEMSEGRMKTPSTVSRSRKKSREMSKSMKGVNTNLNNMDGVGEA